jgi:hypothetical protein
VNLLEIQSSPRGESSDSIALTKSFIEIQMVSTPFSRIASTTDFPSRVNCKPRVRRLASIMGGGVERRKYPPHAGQATIQRG